MYPHLGKVVLSPIHSENLAKTVVVWRWTCFTKTCPCLTSFEWYFWPIVKTDVVPIGGPKCLWDAGSVRWHVHYLAQWCLSSQHFGVVFLKSTQRMLCITDWCGWWILGVVYIQQCPINWIQTHTVHLVGVLCICSQHLKPYRPLRVYATET